MESNAAQDFHIEVIAIIKGVIIIRESYTKYQ